MKWCRLHSPAFKLMTQEDDSVGQGARLDGKNHEHEGHVAHVDHEYEAAHHAQGALGAHPHLPIPHRLQSPPWATGAPQALQPPLTEIGAGNNPTHTSMRYIPHCVLKQALGYVCDHCTRQAMTDGM